MPWYSETWTFVDGEWIEGNPPLTGPRSHAFWQGSNVFDGARYFEGVMPDIERHAERVNRSAATLGLKATMKVEEIVGLACEGAKRFGDRAAYVKPMYWAEADGEFTISPDPDSTRFALCLFEAAMPVPGGGFSLTKSSYRRPTVESAPTDAKAGCLYPNNARTLREAKAKGFSNALVCDALGNVAETATTNIFMARDGEVFTPYHNGTFLNGITRQRVIKLLREAGVKVNEATLHYDDFVKADEIFTSGNYSKIMPVSKIDDRDLQPGPMYRKARELYWDFAHSRAA